MIAKRVPNRKATSSIVKLTRYITGIKATGDPAGWPALADYITDARSDGARVEHVRLTNLDSDEVGPAVKEIAVTQALNTRSRADKNYHLIVSFPPGERPTRAQLDNIEDTLCAAIGLADHQRISATHDDKDHFHMHVAINKVHPATYRNVDPSFDKLALMRTCIELEQRHGLAITPHGQDGERQPRNRQADMEAHSGRESLSGWIATNAAAQLVDAAARATSWQDMHDAAATFGLELRPRGAGLTIGAAGKPEAVKASRVDRRLSFKALSDRLGAFAPAQGATVAEPLQQYRKGPRQSVPGTAALFADYQREREAAQAARKAAREKVDADRAAFATRMRLSHAERRRIVKEDRHRSPTEKRAAYRTLAAERAGNWRDHKAAGASDRAAIDAAHPVPSWQSFLEVRAERGDALATAALRSRQRQRQRFAFDILTADDAEAARHVVYRELAPIAKRNGDMLYQVKDGGRVTDTAQAVRVDQLTVGAAFLALSLAGDKFTGQPLKVEGTDEFKAQIAAVAAMQGVAVTFADPAMEAARQAAQDQRAASAATTPPDSATATRDLSAPADGDAVDRFIAERNKTAARISVIDQHRRWTSADAGPAEYAGRRKLSDGSEAVLLRKNGDVLVKPVTAAQAAKASRWRVGATVTTDDRGRFTDERRRGR